MPNTPLPNQNPLREKLTEYLDQHSVTKGGKHYKGSYLFNPVGYHFIDLYRHENEETATVIVINEREHNYKVKAKYSTGRKYEAEFTTIQEVIDFIDNFSWKDVLLGKSTTIGE
ncbi:hypothetical protein GCM10028819_09630 [Spirosoma humi]